MYFLSTATYKLVRLPDVDRPPYAVLSQTWDADEVLFEDLQGHEATQKAGFAKLREACSIAREDGLGYIWIDTACTNKADPAEVDKSVNSSFELFRSAALCIVHLADVDSPWPSIGVAGKTPQLLSRSRWFTRSWTLQELIAPPRVSLYSRGWQYIGERNMLRETLCAITDIDSYVLGGGDLTRVSIARRMLWAASRNATALEDLSYSLHGLFGVQVPTYYGEGVENAFYRLQEAILMKMKDPSIFAWRDDWAEKYSTWDKCEELVKSPHLRDFLAKSPAYFSHVGLLFPPLGVQDEGSGQEEDLDDWDTSSVASFESSSTLVGSAASGPAQSGLGKAISFLVDNERLIPLFVAAVHQPGVRSSDRLRRNLARLLRRLGQELVIEATTKEETQSAVFLRQYRVSIASAVTMRVSEKYLKPVILEPSEESGMSAEKEAPASAMGAEVDGNKAELDEEDEAENGEVEDSESTQEGKDEPADVDFGNISNFIHNSFAFENMTRALSDFVNPTFHSQAAKIVTKILEGKDMSDSYWRGMSTKMQVILTELRESRPERILVDVESTLARLDRIQVWLESISGENWDWWPLPPPKHIMSSFEARVGWQCKCGDMRWEVVPSAFASIAVLLQRYPLSERQHGSSASQPAAGAAAETLPTDTASSLGTRSLKMDDSSESSMHEPAPSSQGKQTSGKEEFPRPRYMFLVAKTSRSGFKQLPSLYLKTDDFGQELRQAYREFKGSWSYWFSPHKFSHCNFVKFRRFQGGIAHLGPGLPEPDKKDYYFYPRPAQHDPPVSPEEFRHIYNHILEKPQELPYDSADVGDDAVDCIPQRYLYLNERGKKREQFWGLYVQERRSALMTSVYILLCLSPFLIFCVLYLLGLVQGDMQNATTPLALALTSLGLFLGSMIKT